MGMWDMPARRIVTDTELRFNPYHDPQNGRFISAGGGTSLGGYLYSKGGKSAYIVNNVKSKKGLNDYLSDKGAMQSAKIRNTLEKKYNINGKIESEASLVENAVKSGSEFVSVTNVKQDISKMRYESKPKQFEWAKRNGLVRQNQYVDFVKGKLDIPELNYMATGNSDFLSDKYVSREYGIMNGKNTYLKISKTAYDYAAYLKK